MLKTRDLVENKPDDVFDHLENTKSFQWKFRNDKMVFKETLKIFQESISRKHQHAAGTGKFPKKSKIINLNSLLESF